MMKGFKFKFIQGRWAKVIRNSALKATFVLPHPRSQLYYAVISQPKVGNPKSPDFAEDHIKWFY